MTNGDSAVDRPSAGGIRAIQLHVLSGMRGNEALVEQALQGLGADQAELARNQAETAHIFAPTGRFANAVALLGRPLSSETIGAEPTGAEGGLLLTKLTYRLPLWPELVFYLLGAPPAPIPQDFGFARSPDSLPVTLNAPEDLRPWTCLRDEVIKYFGPPVQEGDIWPPYEEYKFQARGGDGGNRQFSAVFSWNLLQHIEWT
jgi:hypothetical protein